LQRVLLPWREVPLEAELEVRPGDARLPWASSAEVSARWLPESPGGPLGLELSRGGGDWARQAWDASSDGGRRFRAEGLTSPLRYRLVSRDRRSRAFTLTPVPFPRFARLTARVERPGGGRAEASLDGTSELEALRGSWVDVRGVPERPLDRAWLEVTGLGGPVPMRRLADGAWEGGFPLREDALLRVHAEAEGLAEPDPPAVQLRAVEDKPPEVTLLSPAFPVEASRGDRLPVAFEAHDDYGLASLSLVYSVDGGEPRALALGGFKPGARSHLGEYDWDLASFPAGAKVSFRLRAADDARPLPHTSVSAPGLVVVADFAGLHARAERAGRGAEAVLAALAEREERLGQALAEAAARPAPERQAAAEALAAQDQGLQRAWDETASSLASFARELQGDPYANPGAAENARALSESVEGMRSGGLAAARQAQRQGELAEAGRRHSALAASLKSAGRALAAGREMQTLQDFWAQTQRMRQSGGELADRLSKLASGKAPTAEEKRELDAALDALRGRMQALAEAVRRMA
ncbi:MAG: hypothetical protein KGL53_13850, partial [Elusimicrobia bacterium]|nr:hypothetical protein [Elusimicrobiota bacterium]